VVHSGSELPEAESERRLKEFLAGRFDVLIQVRKASEGFDAPAVSVLLKLDAVFSREPVIQQLGRGLRFNHELSEAENMLNVFIGRDPRLGPIIEHLEREVPPAAAQPRAEAMLLADDRIDDEEEREEDDVEDEERAGPEVVDVVEAGDAYLDHTGRFVEGQQLTMFGVASPVASKRETPAESEPARVEVVDLSGDLKEAIDYCKTWTNRAAREREKRMGKGENHHAALNLQYARETGRRGSLATASEYRAKGDWMKRTYARLLG
jgi:superfamily II DNA/RNA helicase